MRGRAFAFNQFFQFLLVPIMAFLAYLLVPQAPFGFDGWRWVVLIGVGRRHRRLVHPPARCRNRRAGSPATAASPRPSRSSPASKPQSPPRWAAHCPAPGRPGGRRTGEGTFAEIWQPPYDKRAIMLSVFNFFQTFGYYGFAAWVPTLLIAKGINVTTSLEYAFIIAIANPVGTAARHADRRPHRAEMADLPGAAVGIGVFGCCSPAPADRHADHRVRRAVTLCNNLMSYAFHNYQAELFPTRIRSRASASSIPGAGCQPHCRVWR